MHMIRGPRLQRTGVSYGQAIEGMSNGPKMSLRSKSSRKRVIIGRYRNLERVLWVTHDNPTLQCCQTNNEHKFVEHWLKPVILWEHRHVHLLQTRARGPCGPGLRFWHFSPKPVWICHPHVIRQKQASAKEFARPLSFSHPTRPHGCIASHCRCRSLNHIILCRWLRYRRNALSCPVMSVTVSSLQMPRWVVIWC